MRRRRRSTCTCSGRAARARHVWCGRAAHAATRAQAAWAAASSAARGAGQSRALACWNAWRSAWSKNSTSACKCGDGALQRCLQLWSCAAGCGSTHLQQVCVAKLRCRPGLQRGLEHSSCAPLLRLPLARTWAVAPAQHVPRAACRLGCQQHYAKGVGLVQQVGQAPCTGVAPAAVLAGQGRAGCHRGAHSVHPPSALPPAPCRVRMKGASTPGR